MILNSKEQLMLLKIQKASYKLMSAYLMKLTHLNYLNLSIDDYEAENILKRLIEFDHERTKKGISFVTAHQRIDYSHLNLLCEQAIMIGEPYYPRLWYHVFEPPLLVFYQGELDYLTKPMVSIIGTRKVTDYGSRMAQVISSAVAELGWVSVSGLALGVDTVVHQSAINHPQGETIAVLPCGTSYYYPKSNQLLQQNIAANQLLLSEYLPQEAAFKHHFIERNRLVAGLTRATIVIEAAHKSGSLITANYALQYNRELFVLPGRITDNQAHGCNELIDGGATPIVSIEELMRSLTELFLYQGY